MVAASAGASEALAEDSAVLYEDCAHHWRRVASPGFLDTAYSEFDSSPHVPEFVNRPGQLWRLPDGLEMITKGDAISSGLGKGSDA